MIKNRIALFIIFVAVFVIFWNAVDFLWDTFISTTEFTFEKGDNLIKPIITAVPIGCVFFLVKKKDKSE